MINADGEQIRGSGLARLLESLAEGNTLIRLRLHRRGYEHLTMIKEVRRSRGTAYLVLDYPEGLREAVESLDAWQIELRFTGPDGLQYSVDKAEGRLYLGDVWIRVPETVWRMQRRKAFRLEAPLGTVLHCRLDDEIQALEVIDVSLGGALCAAARTPIGAAAGDRLRHLQVEFPSDGQDLRVHVKAGRVLRIEDDPRPDRSRIALQFVDIDREEFKKLTEFIYRFQRRFLRTRLNL